MTTKYSARFTKPNVFNSRTGWKVLKLSQNICKTLENTKML